MELPDFSQMILPSYALRGRWIPIDVRYKEISQRASGLQPDPSGSPISKEIGGSHTIYVYDREFIYAPTLVPLGINMENIRNLALRAAEERLSNRPHDLSSIEIKKRLS